jgi:hypothetical protein
MLCNYESRCAEVRRHVSKQRLYRRGTGEPVRTSAVFLRPTDRSVDRHVRDDAPHASRRSGGRRNAGVAWPTRSGASRDVLAFALNAINVAKLIGAPMRISLISQRYQGFGT